MLRDLRGLYSTGHACFIVLVKPKINPADVTEPTQNVYIRVSFLLSGSVTEVYNFDFGNENFQPNTIMALPYGGYLLTVSIMNNNQDTRRVYAYMYNGTNELPQVDIPQSIPLSDVFNVFPNNTFWDLSIATGTNWTYVTSK